MASSGLMPAHKIVPLVAKWYVRFAIVAKVHGYAGHADAEFGNGSLIY